MDILFVRFDEVEEDVDIEYRCLGEEFRFFMVVESLNVSVVVGVFLYYLIGNNYISDDYYLGDMDIDVFD